MEHLVSISELTRLRRQRNFVMWVCIALLAITGITMLAAATKTREIILQPIHRSPLEISSNGVSTEYLEMVTRDVTHLTLNRSPENLQYWKESILEVTSPASRGELSTALEQIVREQQGTSVSQYYTISKLEVDPENLISRVSGTLHTVAGSKVIRSYNRKFQFVWTYEGLSLRLKAFGQVEEKAEEET